MCLLELLQEIRRRHRYLAHLPLTCEFSICELVLQPPVLSKETLETFAGMDRVPSGSVCVFGRPFKGLTSVLLPDELEKRKRMRQKKLREEKRREKRIEMEENKKQGKCKRRCQRPEHTPERTCTHLWNPVSHRSRGPYRIREPPAFPSLRVSSPQQQPPGAASLHSGPPLTPQQQSFW